MHGHAGGGEAKCHLRHQRHVGRIPERSIDSYGIHESRQQLPEVTLSFLMATQLTKKFSFSACHTVAGRVLGRNYFLGVTVEWLPEELENKLSAIVHREIISKVHTSDLNMHVDFLKKIAINDGSLLAAFWKRLSGPLSSFSVKYLTLERDSETCATFWPEASE